MPHIDDETLALHALGEPVLDPEQRDHLQTCPACAETVRSLGRVVDAARTPVGTAQADLVAPPPSVWARVRGELDLGVSQTRGTELVAERPDGGTTSDLPGPEREPDPGAGVDVPGPETTGNASGATVVTPDFRARRRWLPTLVAACAALLLGIAGGVLWERRDVEGTEPTVASAALAPLPGWQGASGEAVVQESPDGRRQIVVSVDAPVPEGTYREVWLLRPDVSGLVSLGVLEGDQGRFDLPDGLDLTDYPLVDISEERFDGDPSHSGESVVRGDLSA
jgi:hypothetical protein